MKLTLRLLRRVYRVGERVELFARVANDGPGPVEIPDPRSMQNSEPRFVLHGPGRPQGEPFDRSRTLRRLPVARGASTALTTVDPGSACASLIPLERWLDLHEPGTYRVEGSFSWDGGSIDAEPLEFELVSPHVTSLALSADAGQFSPRTLRLAYSSPGGESRWRRLERELELDPYGSWSGPGARPLGATDQLPRPVSTRSNEDRELRDLRWSLYRVGSTLVASPYSGLETTIDLGPEPAQVLSPAVFSQPGDLRLFVLSTPETGPAHLSALRVPPPANESQPEALTAWSLPLPTAPIATAVAIGAEPLGSPVRLALAGLVGEVLTLCVLEAESAIPIPQLVSVGELVPLPGALDLQVGGDGTRVSCLAIRRKPCEEESSRCELVRIDALLDDSPESPQVTTRTVATLTSPPLGASLTFDLAPSRPEPRWLVQLSELGVLSDQGPRTLSAAPISPLQTIAVNGAFHVAVVDPTRGPRLVPVR